MATTHQSFNWDNWNEKPQVKKGDIGEALVDGWLRKQGYVIYTPDKSGKHPFDRLVATRDKKTVFIADTKTKAMRTFYPDTGIDVRHYNDYMNIYNTHGMHVFLFFVDEIAKQIYGNWLVELDKQVLVKHKNNTLAYPMISNGIRYFWRGVMMDIATLADNDANAIKKHSTRNPVYG